MKCLSGSMKILIINYGMGNLMSVGNALEHLGCQYLISDRWEDVKGADAYILPGVGAFGEAMKNLSERNIIAPLSEQILSKKKPILGICLGMQLIAQNSEEGGYYKGLEWMESSVIKLRVQNGCRLPHVGWNNLEVKEKEPMFNNLPDHPNFYFDHTYQFICNEKYVLAKCGYATEVIAAIRNENIFGTQFHPEKSQVNGLKFLRNFTEYLKL